MLHASEGVATPSNYIGHHREYMLPKGVGFYPMGDRNRCKSEYGVDTIEERDSIDQYTKFIRE